MERWTTVLLTLSLSMFALGCGNSGGDGGGGGGGGNGGKADTCAECCKSKSRFNSGECKGGGGVRKSCWCQGGGNISNQA
ncbi:MAG: hypothetical protein ABEL76_10500, partial [Bradymonadaceae bacterium]